MLSIKLETEMAKLKQNGCKMQHSNPHQTVVFNQNLYKKEITSVIIIVSRAFAMI